MDTTERCRRLAGEIASYFENGIYLDGPAKDYIDACFPDFSFQDLVDRICKEPGFEDAPLMELIFFPDEGLQVRLEPFLEKHFFNKEDEKEIIRLLVEAGVRTTLRESGSNAVASFKIPASVLGPFVRRLRISRQIPRALIDTIHKTVPATETIPLMVDLRNTRFAFSPRVTGFLDCFLRQINPAAECFRDCLGLVLALLDEQKHESDPYLLPEARRELFIRARQSAAQFMQQLQHSNMETLMHRGIRAPEVSIEVADRKIELLERIIEATKSGKGRQQPGAAVE